MWQVADPQWFREARTIFHDMARKMLILNDMTAVIQDGPAPS
jgi:hypothetical protein